VLKKQRVKGPADASGMHNAQLKDEIRGMWMRCSRAVFARAAADQRKDAGKMGAGQGRAESSGGSAGFAGAPMDEVVHFHGKGHVRQQVTKSP
jgi:hypothetical protein